MPRQITSYSNPLVKHVKGLRERKYRRDSRQFMAEGLRILTEARESGRVPRTLFFTASGAEHRLAQALIETTEATGGEAIETSADILGKLSGKDNPQTVLGVFDEFAVTLDQLDRTAADIWLVAERLRDPGNLGTMLRTGDAVGAGALILVGECVDPFSVEAVRASMGALFTVPVVRTAWLPFLHWLRAGRGQLVGLSLQTEHDYRAAGYDAPTFLLTGNEAQGLPGDYARECDLLVKIPMLGRADSLNAAVAASVMAYEVLAQRRA